MIKKKYPNLHGACIDNFHKLYSADLYEQYGILNYNDQSFRLKIETIATGIYDMTKDEKQPYYKEFYVKNVFNFIWKLNIVVDSTFNFASVFTPGVEFKYNYQNHIVEHAVIFINPLNFTNIDSIVSAIYHEIKHIFDHAIKITNDIQQKEVLFRDYLVQTYQLDNSEISFTTYNKNLIQNNEISIMNYFKSFIDYVGYSECTAYLENIDDSYKHDLNNIRKINFLKRKYTYIQIKKFIYLNIQSGNFLLIYYNIEKFINNILTLNNLNTINQMYKQNFKDIYGVNTIQQVLKIYLKRIKKVKIRARKLFNDRYETSDLKDMINEKS